MKQKERFLGALKHQQTDRVPIFANLTPQPAEELSQVTGIDSEIILSRMSQRVSHAELLTYLGNDAVAVRPTWPKHVRDRWSRGELIDDFGFHFTQIGYYAEVIKRPLAHAETVQDVEAFHVPDLDAPEIWLWPEKQIKKFGDTYGIIGDLETSIFELSWNLVGLEKFLVDLYQEEAYINALLDTVMSYTRSCGLHMIELGVDMIWTGDDFGTQTGMFISPELWRKVFKPRMASLFSSFKQANPSIFIAYHSCGAVTPIIPDLIEIGLDVLNPVQPHAAGMDLGLLKKEYGKDLAFFGGVDEQQVLPFGDVRMVEEEVKLRIDQASENGGFIIAPAHNIQPDTPVENILAFFETARSYTSWK